MAIEKVKKYFTEIGEPERVIEFEELTAELQKLFRYLSIKSRC